MKRWGMLAGTKVVSPGSTSWRTPSISAMVWPSSSITLSSRIANEGWIERLPGHGWSFLPMLKSMQSYQDSYRFRLAIEPAAIPERVSC